MSSLKESVSRDSETCANAYLTDRLTTGIMSTSGIDSQRLHCICYFGEMLTLCLSLVLQSNPGTATHCVTPSVHTAPIIARKKPITYRNANHVASFVIKQP
jgi:hypothetical protein